MGRPLPYPQDRIAEPLAPVPSTSNLTFSSSSRTDSNEATSSLHHSNAMTTDTGPTPAELEIIEEFRLAPMPDLPETPEYDFLRTSEPAPVGSTAAEREFLRLSHLRLMLRVRGILETMQAEGRTLRAGSGILITNVDEAVFNIRTSPDGSDYQGDSLTRSINDFVNRPLAPSTRDEGNSTGAETSALGVFVAPDVHLSPSRTIRTSTPSPRQAVTVQAPLTYPIETTPLSPNSRAEAYRRLRTPDVPLHLPLTSSVEASAVDSDASSTPDVFERHTAFRERLEAIRVTSSERFVETDAVLRSARTALRTAVGFAERLEQVTRILTRIADSVVSGHESTGSASFLSDPESELHDISLLPLDASTSLQNSFNQLRAASTRIDRLLEERARNYAAAANSPSTTLGLRVLEASRPLADSHDRTTDSPAIRFSETSSTNPYTPFIPSDLNPSHTASSPIPIAYSRIHLSSSSSGEVTTTSDLVDFSRLRLIPGISYSMRLPVRQPPLPASESPSETMEASNGGRERSRNVASQANGVPRREAESAGGMGGGTGRSWLRIDRNGDAVVEGSSGIMMEGRKAVTKERVGR